MGKRKKRGFVLDRNWGDSYGRDEFEGLLGEAQGAVGGAGALDTTSPPFLADLVLDKTKESVKSYKRGYLKGFEDALAAGRKDGYETGYKEGSQERRKKQMSDYWRTYERKRG